jgi:hypothetical protein
MTQCACLGLILRTRANQLAHHVPRRLGPEKLEALQIKLILRTPTRLPGNVTDAGARAAGGRALRDAVQRGGSELIGEEEPTCRRRGCGLAGSPSVIGCTFTTYRTQALKFHPRPLAGQTKGSTPTSATSRTGRR